MRHDHHLHRTTWRAAKAGARGRGLRAGPVLAAAAIVGALAGAADLVRPAPAVAGASGGFGLCHSGGGTNCVVDGDTFWLGGEKVRIADIDTPETHPPRCAEEAALGARATGRLRDLLNAGPVTLAAADRAHDRYGRRLAIVERDGVSLGETLVAEGLARRWEGRRRGWCG